MQEMHLNHLNEILTIQVMVSYQKIFNARPKNTCFSVKGFSCICRRKCISRKWAFCYLYRWWPAHLGGQPPQIQETSSKIPWTLSVSRTLSVNILIGDRPPPPWAGAYSTSWKIPGTHWHFRSRTQQLNVNRKSSFYMMPSLHYAEVAEIRILKCPTLTNYFPVVFHPGCIELCELPKILEKKKNK